MGRGSPAAFVAGFHDAVILAAAIALVGGYAAHRLLKDASHAAVLAIEAA